MRRKRRQATQLARLLIQIERAAASDRRQLPATKARRASIGNARA